jgi:hypothetical protein
LGDRGSFIARAWSPQAEEGLVPDSISSPKHPVGIVISPGSTRTVSTRLWAFLWSVEPDGEVEPWQPKPSRDKPPGTA